MSVVYLVMVDQAGAHEAEMASSAWTTRDGAESECRRLLALEDAGWHGHGLYVLEVKLNALPPGSDKWPCEDYWSPVPLALEVESSDFIGRFNTHINVEDVDANKAAIVEAFRPFMEAP